MDDANALLAVLLIVMVAVMIVLAAAAIVETFHLDAVCEMFGYEDILRYDDDELCIGRIDDVIMVRPLEELKAEAVR